MEIDFVSKTTGHGFLAPEQFEVRNFEDYKDKLENAKVILDPAKRRDIIEKQADRLAGEAGLSVRPDPALLDEVAGLVEWPAVLMGTIDAAFMEVPPEVLITAMRAHQKYFALEEKNGRLAPRFVFVANTVIDDKNRATITAGNERVLRARLADAKFFWDQDRKATLASRAPALSQIVFHAKLGTLDAKADRMQALAVEIAKHVPGAERDRVRSAARLAKADLTTQMVGEFPELQGLMGRYYALNDGEDPAVADAIAAHDAPQGPNDACPSAPVSVAVALADKIDTLVGFWNIDEKPTGSKDPYALRRAALGVIRLVLENGFRFPLKTIFAEAGRIHAQGHAGTTPDPEPVMSDLLAFFADRLKVHLRERGVRHDLIAAVFALSHEDDLIRLLARVEALGTFLGSDDGEHLLTAYRRAANIVRIEAKKSAERYAGAADPALFAQPEERDLYDRLGEVRTQNGEALKAERFGDAMQALSGLRRPVDRFFDAVTVNCDAPKLRENPLRLLSTIQANMNELADFSRIEG